MSSVISDTSCLIALDRINQLVILKELFQEIINLKTDFLSRSMRAQKTG